MHWLQKKWNEWFHIEELNSLEEELYVLMEKICANKRNGISIWPQMQRQKEIETRVIELVGTDCRMKDFRRRYVDILRLE